LGNNLKKTLICSINLNLVSRTDQAVAALPETGGHLEMILLVPRIRGIVRMNSKLRIKFTLGLSEDEI